MKILKIVLSAWWILGCGMAALAMIAQSESVAQEIVMRIYITFMLMLPFFIYHIVSQRKLKRQSKTMTLSEVE